MSSPSSEQPVVRRRWFVEGRVQGVWFRESTRQEAARIGGLKGWVRNLEDGRVEVVAEGRAGDLERLREFLGRGPPGAQVSGVVEAPAAEATPIGRFEVRR
jgi:acylphosphatase